MTSLLEQRYRRALRLLPAPYRQAWEDDMVATFMERAYAWDPADPEGVELGSPSRAELASIAGLALRLRLGGTGAAPRYLAWGDAVRRVALIGLLANAIGALVTVGFLVWITQGLPGLPATGDALPVGFDNRWQALWSLSGLLWVPAYLSLVHGHRRAAVLLSAAAATPAVVSMAGQLTGGGPSVVSPLAQLLFDALLLAAVAAFHHGAPPVAARPWVTALPAGAVATFAVVLAGQPPAAPVPLVDWPGLWCVGVTAGALICLVATAAGRGRAVPHWPLALTMLAVAAFGLRTVTVLGHLGFAAPLPEQSTQVVVGVAEAAAVLAAGVALAAVSVRALRRLPDAPGS